MPITASSPTIVGPADGESVTLQTIGVRFMIPSADSDARFSLIEHPIPPRALAAPLHRHNREDEYSFVVEGRMGALLGDDVVETGSGDLVLATTHTASSSRATRWAAVRLPVSRWWAPELQDAAGGRAPTTHPSSTRRSYDCGR